MNDARSRISRIALPVALAAAAVPGAAALAGCDAPATDPQQGIEAPAADVAAADLMANVAARSSEDAGAALTDDQAAGFADFSLNLLRENRQAADEARNVLVSPLSVAGALGMAANGAQGNTLAQMEQVLGMPVAQLNASMAGMLEQDDADGNGSGEESPLSVANSIWMRDGLEVKQEFLQANADSYRAGAFLAPFDGSTVRDINAWTSEHTRGMIPSIIDEIPDDAVMYLVNAIAFEGTWTDPYEASDVKEKTFTKEDGAKQDVSLMYSTENTFLEGAGATGFVKRYEEGTYAFAALLPNEGTTVDGLLANLDGAALQDILGSGRRAEVDAALPKFKLDYSAQLAETLQALGMADAFDLARADFSGIADTTEQNLYIDQVAHKTFIDVDEKGTKAAAATAVGAMTTTALPEQLEQKVVHLDRPFVYAIVDTSTNTPVFIGTFEQVPEA